MLREASAQLVLEVRKTVDFYRATAPVERLSRVVLSGGAWEAVGLVDLLASEFGAPVDVFDPFRRVTRSEPRDRRGRRRPGVRRGGRPRHAAGRRPMIRVNLLVNRPGRRAAARVAAEGTALGAASASRMLARHRRRRRRLVVVPAASAQTARPKPRSSRPRASIVQLKEALKLVESRAPHEDRARERLR